MRRVMLLVAALCAAVASNAFAADMPTLRFGFPRAEGTLERLSLVLAQRHGFFTQEGINVEMVWFDPDATPLITLQRQFDALSKGEIDMMRSQVSLFIDAVNMGGDFVAVSAAVNNPVYFLVSKPEIKNFADLKGKPVALTVPQDGITLASRKMLEKHGLGEKDVDLRHIQSSVARVACMKTGPCMAAALSEPSASNIEKEGYHRLGVSNEAGSLLFTVEIAKRGWARSHGALVTAYIQGQAAALRFIHDPKNRDEVVKTAMELTKLSEADTREVLKYYWDDKYQVLPREGEIDIAGLNRMIALEGEYGVLSAPLPAAERFIDLRYLEAAHIQ